MSESDYVQIGRFYFPLAVSGLLMTFQQPVVTAGIARTPEAGTALAAYCVALSLAVLLESPVQMLLPTANALVRDRQSYRLLHHFTLVTGLAFSGLLLLMASSPLGRLVVLRFMGTSPSVARQVFPMLLAMALWPLVVGWRRFCQGILIHHGHMQAISYATACRLLVISAVVLWTVSRTALPGALVGGLALMGGAIAEAGAVTACTVKVLRRSLPNGTEATMAVGNVGGLTRFYVPLAMTSVLTIVTWPLTTAGINHAVAPTLSLAAWSVALSILWLLTTPIQMLQQVAIALIQSSKSLRMVVQFGLAVGLLGSLLLAFFAFTPLADLFLRHIVATPVEIVPLAISATRMLVPLPLTVAGQSLLQGLLISRGATSDVRLAMTINLVALCLLLLGGITYGRLPGAILAPVATTGALLVETAVLWGKFRRSRSSDGLGRGGHNLTRGE